MPFSDPIRLRIKQRAAFSCCLCHALNIEIHHIIPASQGGSDDADNAAPLCPSCHDVYGGNPDKRRFIREARDFWFALCESNFSSGHGHNADVVALLRQAATKTDLESALDKIKAFIEGPRGNRAPQNKPDTPIAVLSVLGDLELQMRLENVCRRERTSELLFAGLRLPDKSKERFIVLLTRASQDGSVGSWADELVRYALRGELEERIHVEWSMSRIGFRHYLKELVERNLGQARAEPDVVLTDLTTAEAEELQARQAPTELFGVWQSAPVDEKPFLLAKWIKERKIRRINFAPGNGDAHETPGFYYMRKGRQLLVDGSVSEGMRVLDMAFAIGAHDAIIGFAFWLAWAPEGLAVAKHPEVIELLRETFDEKTLRFILDMGASYPGLRGIARKVFKKHTT